MNTSRLEEFRVLAHILNYSKAAEKLFISQSILSRHICELERELGLSLFNRDTHSVSLTEEGKFFLKWLEPLLEQTDRTLSAITEERAEYRGSVKIHYSEQSLNTQVLSFIRGFIEAYPDIHLNFIPVTSRGKKEILYSADICLTPVDYTDLFLRNIESLRLCYQEALLAIPPHSRFADRQEVTLAELRDETLVIPYADDLFGPYAQNLLLAQRKCHNSLHRIEAGTPEEMLLKVELGQGLALIPHHLKHRIYPHTRTLPVTDRDCRFPIFLYLNRGNGNPAATLFYEKMRESFHGPEPEKANP